MNTGVFRAYANDGKPYKVLNILTSGVLYPVQYAYSRLFSKHKCARVWTWICFASLPSVLVHTFCNYKHLISRSQSSVRSSLKDERDVHSRLPSHVGLS